MRYLFLIIVLLLILPATVVSQFSFERDIYSNIRDVRYSTFHDLNGDGIEDVVSAGYGGSIGTLGVFLLDEDGSYTYQHLSDQMGICTYFAVVDNDLDGDLDIIGYDRVIPGFFLLTNVNGQYSRTLIHEIDNLYQIPEHGIQVGDLDLNGYPEIYYINIDVFKIDQSNDNEFSEPILLYENTHIYGIWIEDIDSDGDLDFISVRGWIIDQIEEEISFRENINGELQNSTYFHSEIELHNHKFFDIDDNGLKDCIWRDTSYPSRIYIRYQTEEMTFSSPVFFDSGEIQWSNFTFMDINGNGLEDVVLNAGIQIDTLPNSLTFMPINESFELGQSVNVEGITGTLYSSDGFDAIDLYNDGSPELVVQGRNAITIFSEMNGEISISNSLNGSDDVIWSKSNVVFDIEGDGLSEITLNSSIVQDKILKNQGDNVFTLENGIDQGNWVNDRTSSVYFDLNNDNLDDLIRLKRGDPALQLYYQNEEGDFLLSTQSIDLEFDWISVPEVYFEDINGDNAVDILVGKFNSVSASDSPCTLEVIFSMNGEFSESSPSYGINDIPFTNLTVGDSDNDGDMDLFVISGGDLFQFENNGNGWEEMEEIGFLEEEIKQIKYTNINSIESKDLLVVTSNSCHSLSLQLDGSWHTDELLLAEGISRGIVEDFNSDGFDDLVVGKNNYEIYTYLNNQNGSLLLSDVSDLGARSFGLMIPGDSDGDGDLDLICKDTWSVYVLTNSFDEGCTDPSACNFETSAVESDGSCCFGVCGCTDSSASNYNPQSDCDNGSCVFLIDFLVFNDLDGNGSMGLDEPPLSGIQLEIEPYGVVLVSDEFGHCTFESPNISELVVSAIGSPSFPFQTGSSPYFIDVVGQPTEPQYPVGVSFTDQFPSIDVYVSNATNPGLCEVYTTYYLHIRNDGNTNLEGEVFVEYSNLFTNLSVDFDFTMNSDSSFTFNFLNLEPGETMLRSVQLLTPAPQLIGSELLFQCEVEALAPNDLMYYAEDVISQIHSCAYDPNDKRVQPAGYEEPHFIAVDQELEYTVRFQNTGNSPAINVVVEDTISEFLDISTLDIKGASHNMQVEINESERLIRFVFPEIMLPDSTCCLEESQGFVAFAMAPLVGLADGTEINNDAYIYFDNNEAIITNETWSTIMVCSDEMSAIQSDYNLQICEDTEFEFSNNAPWIEEYLWEFDGEVVSSDSLAVLLTEEPGDEVLVLTTSNPVCESTTELDFEVVENDIDGQGFYINDQENLLSLDGFETYQWLLNGDPIDGATNPTYLAPFSGDYGLYVTNSFGCGEFAEEIFAGPVSISELDLELVEVFPNPVSDALSIDFPFDTQTSYQLLDSKGSLITSGNLRKGMNAIDMSALASGLYFLKVDGALESIKVSKN